MSDDMITDGHGNWWERCKRDDCDLHITRPGEADCHHDQCPDKGARMSKGEYLICLLAAIVALATVALVVHAAYTILTCDGTVVGGVISFRCVEANSG